MKQSSEDGTAPSRFISINHSAAGSASQHSINDYSGKKLSGSQMAYQSFQRENFEKADMANVSLAGAKLSGANFRGANLRGANLRGADLRGADLSGAELEGADLSGAILIDAKTEGSTIDLANTSGAVFVDNGIIAQLGRAVREVVAPMMAISLPPGILALIDGGANLSNYSFARVDFENAVLDRAQFGTANLTDANLSKASFRGATFSFAEQQSATGAESNLDGVVWIDKNLWEHDAGKALRDFATRSKGATIDGYDLFEYLRNAAKMVSPDDLGAVFVGAVKLLSPATVFGRDIGNVPRAHELDSSMGISLVMNNDESSENR